MNQQHHHTGLTDAQVLESRRKHGVNVLTPPEKETLWDTLKEACTHWIAISMFALTVISAIAAGVLAGGMGAIVWSMPAIIALATVLILIVGFFGGFGDPLFKILIMAFVLSIGISIYEFCWVGAGFKTFFEPIGIIVALVLATSIAFFLERSNEKTFQSLNVANDDTPVKVVRNNNVCQVPRKDIVVGDIVLLEAGEEIPADCELLESLNLNVNESSLTGELQCAKTTNEAHFDSEATFPSNHIMKGTIILEGNCTAKVLKVGDATESGKVFEAAQVEEGGSTPLSEELDGLADLITKASYVFAALIVIGRIGLYFWMGNADFSTGDGWVGFVTYLLNTVMIAVTLIVVAVPEGLPMSVTLSLAFSMRKLMKENTLPRTMHSCETMGATSVICTDKTGTLTQNRMQVADAQLKDVADDLLAEMIATNTTANLDFTDPQNIKAVGNPTECALLLWLNGKGVDYTAVREKATIVDRLPFSTENKYMATIVKSAVSGKRVAYVRHQDTLARPPQRQGAPRAPPQAARTGGGRHGRRHQRRARPQRRRRGALHGRRNGRGQRSIRHDHPGQLFLHHRQRRDVGPLALQEHPALPALPAHRERHGLLPCALRGLHGHGVAAHRHADALDKPHHGHLRRHSLGLVAALAPRHGRQAARPPRLHPQPDHAQGHSRRGLLLLFPARGNALHLRARRLHVDAPAPHRAARGRARRPLDL